MKVKFSNIVWDTTGDEDDNIHTGELPTELTLEVDNDLNIADAGADFLSDGYGFCVDSFTFEILDNEEIVNSET